MKNDNNFKPSLFDLTIFSFIFVSSDTLLSLNPIDFILLNSKKFVGSGTSKKIAEQNAAKKLLSHIKTEKL